MPGIACAGHWVIDYLKFIDRWPERSEICNIVFEIIGHGGAPFNVIMALAKLQFSIPLIGVGCIGNDDRGREVLSILRSHHLSTRFLSVVQQGHTGFTDVMMVQGDPERTMFHYPGVNELFSGEKVPLTSLKEKSIKLFYLGHLLLMKGLETPDKKFSLAAARLLWQVQQAGMETVLDYATVHEVERYRQVIWPCLSYVDHLVISETEAEKTVDIALRNRLQKLSLPQLKKAAAKLFQLGVKRNIIIHAPEGALWMSHDQTWIWRPSYRIPHNQWESACGAGDAFCSGILAGLHENWGCQETLKLAHATAAIKLTGWDNSANILPWQETLKAVSSWGLRGKVIEGCL